MSCNLRVGSCNVLKTLQTDDIIKIANKVKANCDVVGFQELWQDSDVSTMLAHMSDFEFANLSFSNPIAWRMDKFYLAPYSLLPGELDNRGYAIFHNSDDELPTPVRTGSYAILCERDSAPTPKPVVYFNMHFINKAWNGKEKDPELARKRQVYWWRAFEESQYMIHMFRRRGFPVVWMGDYNRRVSTLQWTNNQVPVALNVIDGIFTANSHKEDSVKVKPENGVKLVKTPSDHDLVVGEISTSH